MAHRSPLHDALRRLVLDVELVCTAYRVDSEGVQAAIFNFLDCLPRVVAAGSLDGTASLFQIRGKHGSLLGGKQLRLTHPEGCAVHSIVVAQLRHRRVVATGCSDGVVRIFDLSGTLVGSFEAYGDGPVFSVQLADSGTFTGQVLCATSTGGGIVVIEGDTEVSSRAFAHLWELRDDSLTGSSIPSPTSVECVASFPHRFGVNGVSLHAAWRRLATASDDRTAGIFDLEGRRLASCLHGSFVWEVALDVESRRVATACEDRCARLFALDGQLLASFDFAQGCCEVALDRDAGALMAASADGTLRLWSVEDFGVIGVGVYAGEVHGAASLLRFGRLVSGTSEGELVEWRAASSSTSLDLEVVGCCHPFCAAAVTVAVG